jgi:phage gp29-like protein
VLSEKYGIPIPITKYKTQGGEADDEAKRVAIEIVRRIGSDGGAAVPDTITLEFHKAFEGDGGGKMQGSLIAYCNRENSKLVNGSTLANDNGDSGGASYALGDIHDGVRWEAVVLDAVRLALAIQTQVYEPMMVYNGLSGIAATPVHHIQVVRDLTPKALVDIANVLKNELGVPVSVEQLRAITGIREPSGPDDDAPGAPVPVTPIGGGARRHEAGAGGVT